MVIVRQALADLSLAALIFDICPALFSIYSLVDAGTRAVIFDKISGISQETVGEGTHFKIPYIQVWDFFFSPGRFSSAILFTIFPLSLSAFYRFRLLWMFVHDRDLFIPLPEQKIFKWYFRSFHGLNLMMKKGLRELSCVSFRSISLCEFSLVHRRANFQSFTKR